MKSCYLPLIFSILLFSCKKEKPEIAAPAPKAPSHLVHSGEYNNVPFSLNESSASDLHFRSEVTNNTLHKIIEYDFYIKGNFLDNLPVTGSMDTTIVVSLEFVINYNISDLDENLQPPPLTASQVANLINGQTEWNDDEETKIFHALYFTDGFGAGTLPSDSHILEMHAQAIGNSLNITGTMDSIPVGIFGNHNWITNYTFDYQFPVHD